MKPFLLSIDNVTDQMWGGHWIRLFKNLPASATPAGEAWELSARPERPSRVQHNDGSWMSLPDLLAAQAPAVLGPKIAHVHGSRLPLLTKFIDAADDLSVQVHPNDEQAPAGENGKSEAWFVLDVAPGEGNGFIYLGFSAAKAESYATRDEFAEAFFAALNQANSMGPSDDPAVRARAARVVLPFLNRIAVKPGDVFDVPPGVVHAIGRGVRLFEIQQASDITYRVWDWNRPDAKEHARGRLAFRTLHLQEAKAVLDFRAQEPDVRIAANSVASEMELVREASGLFLLTKINLNPTTPRFILKTNGVFQSLTVIEGRVDVGGVVAEPGRSVLVPAALSEVALQSVTLNASVLRSTIPI